MEISYFDNSATTKAYPEATSAVCYMMEECFGNPSALHPLGLLAEHKMEEARDIIAHSLGCKSEEIIFTSCGTESNNIAIQGIAHTYHRQGKHIITTQGEHGAVLNTVNFLEKQGFEVTKLPLKEGGRIDYDEFTSALRPDTILVCIMLVNNELGTVYNIQKIKNIMTEQKSKAFLFCDCVQGYLKIPFSADSLGADLLSVSGHKVHGPKGIGALYIRKGVRVSPVMHGGGQERGLKSGTHNTPAICGLGEAVKIGYDNLQNRIAHMNELKQLILESISNMDKLIVNSPSDGAPHIINISVLGARSEVVLRMLGDLGVCVSAGSACSSKKGASYVLTASGLRDERLNGAIRISLGDFNTKEDCFRLTDGLKACIDRFCFR
jgi:cysteine desulfurase